MAVMALRERREILDKRALLALRERRETRETKVCGHTLSRALFIYLNPPSLFPLSFLGTVKDIFPMKIVTGVQRPFFQSYRFCGFTTFDL